MLQIRIGAFETNSSSMHSLIWWTDSEFLDLMQEKAYVKELSSQPGFAYATDYPKDPVWELAHLRYRYNDNRWEETDPDVCKVYETPLACMKKKQKIPFLVFLDLGSKEQTDETVLQIWLKHYPDKTVCFNEEEWNWNEYGAVDHLGKEFGYEDDPADYDEQGIMVMSFEEYWHGESGILTDEADCLIEDIQKISNSTDKGERHV